jgi:hypothetical protein
VLSATHWARIARAAARERAIRGAELADLHGEPLAATAAENLAASTLDAAISEGLRLHADASGDICEALCAGDPDLEPWEAEELVLSMHTRSAGSREVIEPTSCTHSRRGAA